MYDTYKILFISTLITLVITISILLIYNYALTPSKQQDDINKINRYLSELIVGYN